MISPLDPALVSLDELGKIVPGNPHRATFTRWALHGVKGHTLETIVILGKRYTTRESLESFLLAVGNEKHNRGNRSNTKKKAARRVAKARKRLRRAGV